MSQELLEFSEEFAKANQELSSQFPEPSSSDKEDFQILINRALKGTLKTVIQNLILLDKLARNFKHESYTPEFYEFISDEDMINWVHSIKDKQKLNPFDTSYLQFIIEDLKNFRQGNIFK